MAFSASRTTPRRRCKLARSAPQKWAWYARVLSKRAEGAGDGEGATCCRLVAMAGNSSHQGLADIARHVI